jgi:hypothetical protein
MCFFNSAEYAYLQQRADLHPEKRKLQVVFLSKLTHILQGNKVLDAPASNTNGFLQDLHLFLHVS